MTRLPVVLAGVAVTAMLIIALPSSALADSVVRSIPVSGAPALVAVTPDGSTVVNLNAGNEVSVVDVASGVESTPVPLGGFAYNLAISPDGATAIVPVTDGNLWFVQTATSTVIAPVFLGGYLFDVAFSPDGSEAYITTGSSTIIVIDVASRTEVRRFTLLGTNQIYGVAVTLGGTGLLLTDLANSRILEVDASTGAISRAIPVFSLPSEVVVAADGSFAYVGSFVTGSVARVDLGAGSSTMVTLSGPGPLAVLALTPDDSKLYVPRGFGNKVAIVDTATNLEDASLITGVDSHGIAFIADGTTAFVGGGDATPSVLVIAVDRPPLLAATAPAATIGSAYTFSPVGGGSPAPAVTLTGSLPDGLAFDAATGRILGTPTALGSFSFSLTAVNGSGTATQAYTLTVGAAAALAATGVSPAPLVAGAAALLLLGLALRRPRRVH